MNLLVMFGGCSSEYEVSLQSAASVLRNIPEKYNVIKLGITKDGRWFFYDGDTKSSGTCPPLMLKVTVPSSAVSTIKSGVIC